MRVVSVVSHYSVRDGYTIRKEGMGISIVSSSNLLRREKQNNDNKDGITLRVSMPPELLACWSLNAEKNTEL
jgi:hypothetical protein